MLTFNKLVPVGLGDDASFDSVQAEGLTHTQLLEYPMPELGRTLLELVLSSGSAHEAHHGGQISYLRGLQSS